MSRDLSIYQDPRRFGKRARRYQRRRQLRAAGVYVLGRWLIDQESDTCFLEAVAEQPGYWIDRNASFTRSFRQMYRWSTRQSVHQFLKFHPEYHGDCMPINVGRVAFRSRFTKRQPGL